MPTTVAYMLAPFAPKSSEVHAIVSEDKFLQYELDRMRQMNSGELESKSVERETQLQNQRLKNAGEIS